MPKDFLDVFEKPVGMQKYVLHLPQRARNVPLKNDRLDQGVEATKPHRYDDNSLSTIVSALFSTDLMT